MTDPNSEMLSKYKKLGGLDVVDYPKNEHVFSWNRDSPYIRPETYKCANCNHSFIGRERCDGRKCEKCGYPIKLYGYPDLVHDTFFDMDEVPYDFEENGYYKNTLHEYRQNERNVPVMVDAEDVESNNLEQELGVNHTFQKEKNMLEQRLSDENNQDQNNLPDNYSEVDEKHHVEHMDGNGYFLCGFVVTRLFLFLIALFIADYRGELRRGDKINWSLVGCVFFFPDIYFAYAIFEWLVRPKC
jgi:hypothetical protein